MPHRLTALGWTALALAWLAPGFEARALDDSPSLQLRLRSRVEADGLSRLIETPASWAPKETAFIVCDMWDSHHCLGAVRREKEMAPVMEKVLQAARARGVTIIHAPSGCMETYKDHPARKHATETPRGRTLPKEIGAWCYKIPNEEKGVYPIDQTDGGEDDDPAEHQKWVEELAAKGLNPKAPWKAQIGVLAIADQDYLSDNGEEIWSILEARGIKNVALMGVHLNMCVLGRPFGLRQMAKNGKNVVLMRDMTDTMYNPKRSPYVSHFAGTDLIVEHVEKYVCPTITSDQILGGQPFRFKEDPRPRVAFVIGDDEYKTESTLPAFATAHLLKDYQVDYILDQEGARDNLASINLLDGADLCVISARRRVLPKEQVDALRRFVAAGKPIIGLRTASHAFSPKPKAPVPPGHDAWLGFDAEVLGGHYVNHHGAGPSVVVTPAPSGTSHPILDGVDISALVGHGSLYKVSPLAKTATPLLMGTIPGQEPEPVAWVNAPIAGNRVFYTSLGQLDDFRESAFNRLLKNAVAWGLGR